MTQRDALLLGLAAENSADRLRAARTLQRDVNLLSRAEIQAAIRREPNAWVRRALEEAIADVASEALPRPDWALDDAALSEFDLSSVRASAIQTVSRLLLREVRGQLLPLKVAAMSELGDYDESTTRKRLERLSDLLDTIGRLASAAEPPRVAEFDLSDAIRATTGELGLVEDSDVRYGREEPTPTSGDWDLIQFAFTNAVRNAMEASAGTGRPITISWGSSDKLAWISVLDEGIGLPADGGQAHWKPGATTKSKDAHFGWGLPIARQAIDSCSGHIELRPRTPVGVACEISWPTSLTPNDQE